MPRVAGWASALLACGAILVGDLCGADADAPEIHGVVRVVAFRGLTAIDREQAERLLGVRVGETFSRSALARGVAALEAEYGRRGYVRFNAAPELDAVDGGVRVLLHLHEGEPYRVGRIEFSGHGVTRDEVLRRRMLLDEGDRMDTGRLSRSVRRLNELGFVSVRDVTLSFPPAAPGTADVHLQLERRAAPRYGASAGYTGLYGLSLSGSLGTVDLFGYGESLWLSLEGGRRLRRFDIAARAPSVLGTPYTVSVKADGRSLELESPPDVAAPEYDERSGGVGLSVEREIGSWAGASLAYEYRDVSVDSANPEFAEGRWRESRLSLSGIHDTVDDPWTPHRGLRVRGTLEWVGGPLGGDREYARLWGRFAAFVPTGRRTAAAFVVEAGRIAAFGATAGIEARTLRNRVPIDQRYLLGGEWSLRGFAARAVGPRDASGTLVGGDKFVLASVEQHVDVWRGLRALAFADAGQAFAEGQPVDLSALRVSLGVELRVRLPVLNVPLRLIAAANPRRDPLDERSSLRVAVGPVP